MRTSLLTSAAAAALLAASPGALAAEGKVLKLFGGANWLDDYDGGLAVSTTVVAVEGEADIGFVAGASAGYEWANGISLALEYSYRTNSLDADVATLFTGPGFNYVGETDGDLDTHALLVNVAYEFDTGMRVRPFVLGGIGIAWNKIDVDGATLVSTAFPTSTTSFGDIKEGDAGFAWQVGGGVAVDLSPNASVTLEYRYFDGGEVAIGTALGELDDFDVSSHNALLGLRFRLP